MITVARVGEFDRGDVIARSKVAEFAGVDKTLDELLILSAFAWSGEVDGKIACVWGLIPPSVLSEQAYLWLLTTDLIEEHKFLFTRYSQRVVEMMLQVYPTIVGHIDQKEARAVQWLKWLGAEIIAREDGQLHFSIRRKD